jgi:hypothetical protein
MKKYTIKGNGCPDYGKHIINFFEKLGGSSIGLEGTNFVYYYITDLGTINDSTNKPKDHTEIKLLPNGMGKGVWYKNKNGDYFKPKEKRKKTHGVGVHNLGGGFMHYEIDDYWTDIDIQNKNFTPLTDLTEIQEFLPDGHEDKYKPEPTDSIKPSTEDILKLIYEKWGEDALIYTINHTLKTWEYHELKGKYAQKKAENLIQKWQPKPKIWKEDGIIMISTDAPEGAVEYTQERLNGLLNINI